MRVKKLLPLQNLMLYLHVRSGKGNKLADNAVLMVQSMKRFKQWLPVGMFLLLPGSFIQAQTVTGAGSIFNTLSNDSRGGKIRIYQDQRIQMLINKHTAINYRTGKIPGWRIRIYSDLGSYARDASLEAKTRFLTYYPEIPVYRQYASPYFKVYVGDFRTRLNCLRALRKIKEQFPNAFPVQTKINYPEVK